MLDKMVFDHEDNYRLFEYTALYIPVQWLRRAKVMNIMGVYKCQENTLVTLAFILLDKRFGCD